MLALDPAEISGISGNSCIWPVSLDISKVPSAESTSIAGSGGDARGSLRVRLGGEAYRPGVVDLLLGATDSPSPIDRVFRFGDPPFSRPLISVAAGVISRDGVIGC